NTIRDSSRYTSAITSSTPRPAGRDIRNGQMKKERERQDRKSQCPPDAASTGATYRLHYNTNETVPCKHHAFSFNLRKTASPTSFALAGFCPVINSPSSTTWATNGNAFFSYFAPRRCNSSSKLKGTACSRFANPSSFQENPV